MHHDPFDDTAWLALSDWLEEHDDPRRAEILRSLRILRGMPRSPQRLSIETRVQQLLAAGVVPFMPTLVNSLGMEFVLLPPLSGTVGSPEQEVGRYGDEPLTAVELTYPFYLATTAVTQSEYEQLMGKNPSAFQAKGRMRRKVADLDTSTFPVESVTWHDADAFCRRLSDLQAEQEQGRRYRLPTEIEWELACRAEASQMTAFPYGPTLSPRFANFKAGARAKTNLGRPAAVRSYPPNAFGLYEMIGNLWEWCADWFQDDQYQQMRRVDPPLAEVGERRNARGGTYNLEARRARSADRSSFEPNHRDSDLGFRVLLEWQPPRAKQTSSRRR
ncbi:MAG: SUMF1/EgtB/PvdO family nonheme iron enzyme [Gemmataceae bacterium]